MSHIKTAARLGEVLADKGVITHLQLQEAIRVQQERRQLQSAGKLVTLGEIMIELGYIDRYQLHRGLNWQSYLRKLTMVVAFCAPLMTMGCGGEITSSEEKPAITQPEGNTFKPLPEPVPTPEPSALKGPVDLSWTPPALRKNGETLDITELGGYELRYKLKEDQVFTYMLIQDPWKTEHHFEWLEGNYEFQIAAYDNDGIYSDFVNLTQRQN